MSLEIGRILHIRIPSQNHPAPIFSTSMELTTARRIRPPSSNIHLSGVFVAFGMDTFVGDTRLWILVKQHTSPKCTCMLMLKTIETEIADSNILAAHLMTLVIGAQRRRKANKCTPWVDACMLNAIVMEEIDNISVATN